jgi:hypothetical protein
LDTSDELRDLARRGAVGDIGLRFFDREGLTKRLQQFFGGEFVADERVDELAHQASSNRFDLTIAAGDRDRSGRCFQLFKRDADDAVIEWPRRGRAPWVSRLP